MLKLYHKKNAFTLIEILLSVVLISIIAGLSAPVYNQLRRDNDLDLATNSLASAWRRAQMLAAGGYQGGQWGVKVTTDEIIIFRGGDFVNRDQNYDEIYVLPQAFDVSGLTEALFTQPTGLPSVTGSVQLSSHNEQRNITINNQGVVIY